MDTRMRIAFHESGHVVVAALAGLPVQSAVILAEADSAGKCYLGSSDLEPAALAMIYLAGVAAVRRADPTEPAVLGLVDAVCAQELLRAPSDTAATLAQVVAIAAREADALVALGWPAIERVAGRLARYGYITAEEIQTLCAPVAAREE